MWKNPVRTLRRLSGLTQAELAAAGGTSQPTIAAYEAGDRVPNLRTAARLADAAGLEMTVEFGLPLTREDRRSLALHEVIAEKVGSDPGPAIERARRTLTRMRAANPGASPILEQWSGLLDLPPRHLVDLLLDPRPFARELRHCTPFAGLLSASERSRVYRDFVSNEAERARGWME